MRQPYVSFLCRLVAATEQHQDDVAATLHIDPVAGATVHAKLTDALADRLGIAPVALGQPIQTRGNKCPGAHVLEPRSSFAKMLGLQEPEHM